MIASTYIHSNPNLCLPYSALSVNTSSSLSTPVQTGEYVPSQPPTCTSAQTTSTCPAKTSRIQVSRTSFRRTFSRNSSLSQICALRSQDTCMVCHHLTTPRYAPVPQLHTLPVRQAMPYLYQLSLTRFLTHLNTGEGGPMHSDCPPSRKSPVCDTS